MYFSNKASRTPPPSGLAPGTGDRGWHRAGARVWAGRGRVRRERGAGPRLRAAALPSGPEGERRREPGPGEGRALPWRRVGGGPRPSPGLAALSFLPAAAPSRAAPPPHRRHGQVSPARPRAQPRLRAWLSPALRFQLPRVPCGLQRQAERRPALPRRRQRDLHAGPRGERALHLRG